MITVTKDGAAYLMRVNSTRLVRNGMQEIATVAEDVSSYDFYNPAGAGTPNSSSRPPVFPPRGWNCSICPLSPPMR